MARRLYPPAMQSLSASEILRVWTGYRSWIICGVLLLVVARVVRSFFNDGLRKIPGPTSARFTKFWLFLAYWKGDFEKTNLDLHKKHGPIVRIAPNEYSLDDVHAAKIIYGHDTKFSKADWYGPWGHPEFMNLFNEQNVKAHAALRRKLSNAYSMSRMLSYEKYVDDCLSIFQQRLSEFAVSGAQINLGHWLQCFAFDLIGMITFAKRFGFLDSGEDIMNMMSQIDEVNQYSALIGVFPSLNPIIFKIVQAFGLQGSGIAIINDYSQELMKKYSKSDAERPTSFLANFIEFREKNPGKLSDDAIRAGTGANMFAGSDTTSISLSSILLNLYKQPAVLAKLRRELEDAQEAGKISDPVTFQQAQHLPYLQAVIKEGLRIHPATGFTMPRVVPPGGAMLLDTFFPEGSIVGINAWVAHMNREVYGEDAAIFRPERWLEEPSKYPHRDFYFFTFGQGSRTCVGKNIALLEISKAIPQLVRHFDFEVDRDRQWETHNSWFVKPQNFKVKVKKNKRL